MSKLSRLKGDDIFYLAKVIGSNDHQNQGRVRIQNIMDNASNHLDHIEKGPEQFRFAEVLNFKSAGSGFWITPEFGDIVMCMDAFDRTYIIGSITKASDTPVECQNISNIENTYWSTHFPSLVDKGYHDPSADFGSKYKPDAMMLRWRKNDFLMVNSMQINDKPGTTQKFMELRTNENQLFQMVDIGNAGLEAGVAPGDIEDGNNAKKFITNRQTDYRDLWDGLPINNMYWTEKQDHAPDTHESQYIRLATNNDCYHEIAPPSFHGADNPDLTNGNSRLDDRINFGQHETSKTYAPSYQKPTIEKTDQFRYPDEELDPDTVSDNSKKNIYHIEQLDVPKVSKDQQVFNFGHHVTISNTIFKKRIQIESKKKHQLIMSDIDMDEKLILRSMRHKYLYMEDSNPDDFDFMQLHNGHSINFAQKMQSPGLVDDKGNTRDLMPDGAVTPSDFSSYLLIQSENKMRTWYSDTPKSQRIHTVTTKGHEILLCDDHMSGEMDKIQITSHDKTMQQVFDVNTSEISIMNTKGKTKVYSKSDISLDTGGSTWIRSKGRITVWSETDVWVDAPTINLNCDSYQPHVPFGPQSTPGSTLDTPNKITQDERPTPY